MTGQQERDLKEGLRALAGTTREMHASRRVEDAVLAELGRLSGTAHGLPQTTRATRKPALVRLLPLAAALVAAVGGALWTARSTPSPKIVHPAGFIALPAAAVLPEMESANIVRVSLPVAALPAYGVAIGDLKQDVVEAELLVAQDGQARAIRFVSDSD
jgi:hypothetical protein